MARSLLRMIAFPQFCLRLVLGVAVAGALAGCKSSRSHPPARQAVPAGSQSSLAELHLMAMPVAVDLDGSPGTDGILLKVFAVNADHPKPQYIRSGQLDILLFDGVLESQTIQDEKRWLAWNFTPVALAPFAISSPIGIGYNLSLPWGQKPPTKDRVTVVAKYTPAKGQPIYSAPSAITVSAK